MPQPDAWAAREPAPARILVVEDDPLVRFPIAEALRELGVSVIEAASAGEAWEYLKSGGPVDLVFTDHHLRGPVTGAQLAVGISRQYPGLEVVVTSGQLDFPGWAASVPSQGWTAPVLGKPYGLFETAAALAESALRNRRQEGADGAQLSRHPPRRG